MNRKITIAAGGLAVALLALTPIAAQADSTVSVSVSGDTIQAVGDASSNYVEIADQTDPACPGGSPCYEIGSTYAGDPVVASAPCVAPATAAGAPNRALCPGTGVSRMTVFGRDGSDRIVVSDFLFGLGLQVDLHGGPDEDFLSSAGGADTIRGNEGADTIRSRGGDDVVLGNAGADRIYASKGEDTLVGGAGFDNLIGGLDDDRLFGRAGNDGMDGAQGRDRCDGGKGRDTPRRCETVK